MVQGALFSVTVSAGVADHLTFATPPGGSQTAGIAWTPADIKVEVRDQFDNLADNSGTTVTLPGDGTAANGGFSGNTAVTASGIATFNSVTYATAESINVGASATI